MPRGHPKNQGDIEPVMMLMLGFLDLPAELGLTFDDADTLFLLVLRTLLRGPCIHTSDVPMSQVH
jgi:hypothetical protein